MLNVDGNPLRTPPKEIVKKGRKEIMGYLKDLAKGSEQCYRVKLMVVGQENVGKTTLIRKLNQKKRRTVRRSSKAPDMNVSTGEWESFRSFVSSVYFKRGFIILKPYIYIFIYLFDRWYWYRWLDFGSDLWNKGIKSKEETTSSLLSLGLCRPR